MRSYKIKHHYAVYTTIKDWEKMHNQNKYTNQKMTQSLKKCIEIIQYTTFS